MLLSCSRSMTPLIYVFCMQVVPPAGLAGTDWVALHRTGLLAALLLLRVCRKQVIVRAARLKCSRHQSWHLHSMPCTHTLSASCLQFQATASALTAAIFSLNPKFSQLADCYVTRLAALDFGCSILTTVFGGQQAVLQECLPCIYCMQRWQPLLCLCRAAASQTTHEVPLSLVYVRLLVVFGSDLHAAPEALQP